MVKLLQLATDISSLWAKYSSMYLVGAGKTLTLAIIGTLIGCIIGFACGILQTIPCVKTDSLPKRFFWG